MNEPGLLILVKHSYPVINSSQPANQWHLSEVGKRRCKTLAEKLSEYNIQAIITSLEPKAVETAEITACLLGLPVKRQANFHEHDRSKVTPLNIDQFESSVAAFFANPDQLVFGCETAVQAFQRFDQAIQELIAEEPMPRLAVISHGTVISLFAAHYNEVEPYILWKRLGLPSFLVLSSTGFQLLEIVDTIL